MTELRKIFDKYGADKGYKHHYDTVYDPLFAPKKDEKINFLEIGIWKGLGMESLRDYFPKGRIYGVDIFTRIKPEEVSVLQKSRTRWLKADSTDPKTYGLLREQFNIQFDYILDDGAHWPAANKLTFRHTKNFLKPGGLYIIEDVWPLDIMMLDEMNHPWLQRYPERYSLLEYKSFMKELEESGFEINKYDLRGKSGNPDSYVITLRKPE